MHGAPCATAWPCHCRGDPTGRAPAQPQGPLGACASMIRRPAALAWLLQGMHFVPWCEPRSQLATPTGSAPMQGCGHGSHPVHSPVCAAVRPHQASTHPSAKYACSTLGGMGAAENAARGARRALRSVPARLATCLRPEDGCNPRQSILLPVQIGTPGDLALYKCPPFPPTTFGRLL